LGFCWIWEWASCLYASSAMALHIMHRWRIDFGAMV
jgi:hypothetical protein